jgi:hypothetical protein
VVDCEHPIDYGDRLNTIQKEASTRKVPESDPRMTLVKKLQLGQENLNIPPLIKIKD